MTTLDEDEQAELSTKLRFGIGLEQLVGAAEAARIRALGIIPRHTYTPAAPDPPCEPADPAQVRAKAAALGIGAGRRGQWLSR